MDLKLSFSIDYKKYLQQTLTFVNRWQLVIASLIVLSVFSYAIVRISTLSDPEANQDRFTEQLSTLRKVNIDADSVDKIQQLRDSNIDITSDFTNNRDNPFAE